MNEDDLNTACVDSLRSIKMHDYIVVVGSGPSCPYIAPSEKLQDALIRNCSIHKIEGEHFWKLAQRAYDDDPDVYFQVIHDEYGKTPFWQARTYKHIASIPFNGFITFNYDDQLPLACQEAMGDRFEEVFSVYPPREGQRFKDATSFLASAPQVACVHGYCDSENPDWHKQVILKESDYDFHYALSETNKLFEFWRAILTFSNCIFIGTSLDEPGLFEVIDSLKAESSDAFNGRRHLLLKDVAFDPSTSSYPRPKKKFGVIEELFYDKIDDRYMGLINILGEFSRVPIGSPSPRVPAIPLISKTTNQTSYND